jgi:protease-4
MTDYDSSAATVDQRAADKADKTRIENVAASAAENVIDRQRLRRKLRFWRIAAVLVLLGAIGFGAAALFEPPKTASRHIARLSISGLVTGDRETLKLIEQIGKSSAAGVLVTIESPGGTTTGAEKIYEDLRRLAEKKPVVAVIGTTGASGAYIAALGAERIFAHGNSLVGSIGVLFQYPNMTRLLDTVGVKMEEIKSSPLKASPNPFEPATPEARAALAALVTDSYDWFRGLVRERRALNDQELANVADGRVFTGRQALGLKLVDQLGGERAAIAWLEAEKGVEAGLTIRDWRPPGAANRFGIFSAASVLAHALGWNEAGALLQRLEGQSQTLGQSLALDGLVAVWHGQGSN